MNYALRTLTFSPACFASVVVGFLFPVAVAAQGSGQALQDAGAGQGVSTDSTSSATDGQDLVASAVRSVALLSPLQAKIRLSTDMFDHQLIGTGNYLQTGSGRQQRMRLELKMQLAGSESSLLQIRSHGWLWTRRASKDGVVTERVDLNRVEQAIRTGAGGSSFNWMLIGGLPKLLASLRENFDFGTARPGMLGEFQVWETKGRWKPDRLSKLIGDSAGRPEIPDGVAIVMLRDKSLPFFPHRIEMLKEARDPSGGPPKPMMTIELYDICRPAHIRPDHFTLAAEAIDTTDDFLKRLTLVPITTAAGQGSAAR